MDKTSIAHLFFFSGLAILGIVLIFLHTPLPNIPIVVYSLIMIGASTIIITTIIINNGDDD